MLNRFVSEDTFDYRVSETPRIVGGYVLRTAFTEEELYKIPGFGFHLMSPKPKDNLLCDVQTTFTQEQEIFEVDDKDGISYKIGIPCPLYPESYTIMYKSLGKSWVG